MAILFRRNSEEDDLEDEDEIDAGDDGSGLPEIPSFAVIVSEVATDGWHMAAVVGESSNPDFYVRALTVRWPFVIARPSPSNRASDKPVDPDLRSPTGTTPAHKLVVNWGWVGAEGSVSQLRFYVKRTRGLFNMPSPVKLRITIKESAWPRRRIVLAAKSNRVIWDPPEPEMPESPPERST